MVSVVTAVSENTHDQIVVWREKWKVSETETLRRLIDLGLQSLGKNQRQGDE